MADVDLLIRARDQASASLKQISSDLKVMEKELRKASDAFERTGQGADDVDRLTRAIDLQRQAAARAAREGRNLGKQIDASSRSWTKVTGVVERYQRQIRTAGIVAVGAAVLIGKKSVDQFARVQDATDALNATFGATGQAMIDWANTSGDALNLSKAQALDAAQTFAIFGDSAGLTGRQLESFATTLAGRAADAASYFGGTTADAIAAFSSALRGEAEPARRYGVLLDDATLRQKALTLGITDTVKTALTPQQKILAANAVLLEQTSRVTGDVARTADSMANKIKDSQQQMADFQVTVGQTVSVGLSPFLTAANGAMQFFTRLPGPVQQAAVGVGLLGVGFLALGPRVLSARASLLKYQTAAVAAGTASMFTARMARIANVALGPVGLAVGVVTTAIGLFTAATKDATQEQNLFEGQLTATGVALDGSTEKLIRNALYEQGAIDAARKLGISTDDLVDSVLGQADATDRVTRATRTAYEVWEDSTRVNGQATQSQRDLADAADTVTLAVQGSSRQLAEERERMWEVEGAAGGATDAFGAAAWATRRLDYWVASLDASYKKLLGQLDQRAKWRQALDAQDALVESLKKNGVELDRVTRKGRENEAAVDAWSKAALDAAPSLDKPIARAMYLDEQIASVSQRMDTLGVPEDVQARVLGDLQSQASAADTAAEKMQRIKDIAAWLQGIGTIDLNVVMRLEGAATARERFLNRASGGPVLPGQQYMVGEVGPELFVPTVGPMRVIGADGPQLGRFSEPGYVVPNHALAEMAAHAASVATAVAGPKPTGPSPAPAYRGPLFTVGQINATSDVDLDAALTVHGKRALRLSRERGAGE